MNITELDREIRARKHRVALMLDAANKLGLDAVFMDLEAAYDRMNDAEKNLHASTQWAESPIPGCDDCCTGGTRCDSCLAEDRS